KNQPRAVDCASRHISPREFPAAAAFQIRLQLFPPLHHHVDVAVRCFDVVDCDSRLARVIVYLNVNRRYPQNARHLPNLGAKYGLNLRPARTLDQDVLKVRNAECHIQKPLALKRQQQNFNLLPDTRLAVDQSNNRRQVVRVVIECYVYAHGLIIPYQPPQKTLLLPSATVEPHATGSPIRPICKPLTYTVLLPAANRPPCKLGSATCS